MNFRNIYTFSLTVILYIGAAQGVCKPDKYNHCCQGFFFDAISNECKECPSGYIGFNCSMECRYPGYGKYCQEHCNCSEELCDVSTGCLGFKLDSSHNEEMLPEINSTISGEKSRNLNNESKTTPILIGVIVSLTFLLLVAAGNIIWKNVKQANPRITQRQKQIQSLENELNKTAEKEGAKENFYDDMNYQKADEGGKEGLFSSENGYIDTEFFSIKGKKTDNRESNHFYDALK